jgi:catechol 2,3-dioxygenase-like lactoylglutathione lyase family enzyme
LTPRKYAADSLLHAPLQDDHVTTPNRNDKFDIQGINHLALVCKDMKRTVDFYSGLLGMPLIKTINLPGGSGQHFFFDVGNGDALAFFWFADAPASVPGVTHPAHVIGRGSLTTAHASMNHVAFNVAADRIDEYQRKLTDAGIPCTPVVNHDESPMQASGTITPSTFVRSIYFNDPDGIMLEFAAWTRPMDARDVNVDPVDADGVPVPVGA